MLLERRPERHPRIGAARAAILAAVAAVLLAGCGEGGHLGESETTLTLLLTDHPAGDLQSAWVQVDSVRLYGQSGGAGLTVHRGRSDFIEVSELRSSRGEFEVLVEDAPAPSGTYGAVRVFLGGAAVRDLDGHVFARGDPPAAVTSTDPDTPDALPCPACGPRGVAAKLPPDALRLEAHQHLLLVDFDVSQSFSHAPSATGGPDGWTLHPVTSATVLGRTGRLVGEVEDRAAPAVTFPACGGVATGVEHFEPLAVNRGVTPPDTLTGQVRADSTWALAFAPPGTYAAGFERRVAFADGDTLVFEATATPGFVDLPRAGVRRVDYELDAVACTGSP